jgi:hypothetical protein
MAIISVVSVQWGFAVDLLTRDPTSVAKLDPLTGVLSNLGCLVWGASAAIWLFCAALHRRWHNPQKFQFAVSSGLLSAYLTCDDLFLFHDVLARRYFGVGENVVYAVLGIAVGFYLFIFRKLLLKPDGLLLLLSFAFLGFSLVLDTVFEPWLTTLGAWLVFFEDGAKWLGIVCWCAFCVVRCRADVLNKVAQPSARNKAIVARRSQVAKSLVSADEQILGP